MKVCFATNNPNKLREVQEYLSNTPYQVQSLQDIGCQEEIPETSGTIEGNSEQKATFIFEKYGIPCFADDTGLEVDALEGKPGVDSAMYAGDHRSAKDNNYLLLSNLSGQSNRKAQFKTVITWVDGKNNQQFVGIAEGKIIEVNKGTKGFGYDPIFLPAGHSKTFAEMTTQEKNRISHRALATRQLIDYLTGQKK